MLHGLKRKMSYSSLFSVTPLESDEEAYNFECWCIVTSKGDLFLKTSEFLTQSGYRRPGVLMNFVPGDWAYTWEHLTETYHNISIDEATIVRPRWKKTTKFVNELGFHFLMGRSNRVVARRFSTYVYTKVLPAVKARAEHIVKKNCTRDSYAVLFCVRFP